MQLTLAAESLPNLWEHVSTKWKSIYGVLVQFEPGFSLMIFAVASFLMIWRLGVLERKGLEGTVLGTVIMPYASGFSNLAFAYFMGRSGGNGSLVLENCIVNNVTNLTLLIGLPALLWPLTIFTEKATKARFERIASKSHRLNYLSLLLTILALLFFTGVLWALARDGKLDFGDGLVLVGVFLFWQIFHVFDVLKHNIYRGQSPNWTIIWDIFLVIVGGIAVYQAIEGLVAWIPRTGTGLLVFRNLGWLSGLLMVLPNALLALFYAHARRADIVFSSQIGDGHICIPMCIGLFALFGQITIPDFFHLSVIILISAGVLHLILIALWGRLPRTIGLGLVIVYGFFLYKGILA